MELTLEVRTGDDAGRRIAVPAGGSVRVGRAAPAEVRLAADPMLSAVHFAVEWADGAPRVRDLGSRFGTLVNGVKVADAAVKDGDEVRAGRTVFAILAAGLPPPADAPAVSVSDATPPPAEAVPLPVLAPPPPAPAAAGGRHAAVAAYLRRLPDPLFALLDAAREPSVVGRMERSGLEFRCLYDGDRGDELSAFGPWLVRLPADAAFLDELVRDGWGHSWGVYLTSGRSLDEVRRHLRQFLKAQLPDGRRVFFRFYDPRVLRTYLPSCTREEVTAFVGPVGRYVAESADVGEVLEFAAASREWRRVALPGPVAVG